MPKVSINFDMSQIKEIIEQLDEDKKITLLKGLEKETWSKRFRQFLAGIDKKMKGKSITEEEINEEVEKVRKSQYEKSNY